MAEVLEKHFFFFWKKNNLKFSLKHMRLVNICALYSSFNVVWCPCGIDCSEVLCFYALQPK